MTHWKKWSDIGYHLTKCHIITNKHLLEKEQQIFVLNELERVDGCRVIERVRGSDSAEKKFLEGSLIKQKLLLKKLAFHGNVSTENAPNYFTFSTQYKWKFVARLTTTNIKDLLKEGETNQQFVIA